MEFKSNTYYDIVCFATGLVDILTHVDDAMIQKLGLTKGTMLLVDDAKAKSIRDQLPTDDWESSLGGSALNTIRISAQLGLKNFFSTRVGQDKLGEVLIYQLTALGIEHAITTSEHHPTGTVMSLITQDGERTMATNLGASLELATEHVKDYKCVSDAKIFYFTGYKTQKEGMFEVNKKAIAAAKNARTKIAFDLADPWVITTFRVRIDEIINEADILFMNEEEYTTYSKQPVDNIRQVFPKAEIIVIKKGKKGCIIAHGEQVIKVPGFPEHAIDTTGAGDSFAAGFLTGMLKGLSVEQSAKLANFIGSKVVQNIGSRLTQQNIKDIKIFQKTLEEET